MFKQFSYNTLFRLIGFAVGFILSVSIARGLGSDEYGIFAIFLTIGGLISGIGMFGFPNYVIKNISIAKTLNSKIIFVFLNSLVIVLLLIVLFKVFESNIYSIFKIDQFQFTNALYFLGFIVFASSNILLRSVFEGFHNSQGGYLIKEVLGRLFKLVPIFFIHITIQNVFIVFLIAELVVFLIFIVFILYKYDFEFDKKKRLLSQKEIIPIYRYTLPLFATTLVLIFNGQIIKLLLGVFEESKYVGYYDLSLNFSALMIIGLNIQNTVLKPYFSKFFNEDNLQAIHKYYLQSSKILTIIFLPLGLFFLGVPKAFLLFYGQEYYDASLILQLIIISSIINISTGSNYPILVMSRVSHKEFNANILNFLSVMFLGLLFIYLFGYLGAGLVMVVSQSIVNIYRIVVLKKEFGFLPYNNIYRICFLLISSIGIVFSLSLILKNSTLILLPPLLLVIGFTCYLFVKLEFLPGEIKDYYRLFKNKVVSIQ